MDIWTILTIVSIPPTVAYYGVKWHRARLAKRREEIVRRVQTGIPLERAVYRLREKDLAEGGVTPPGTPAPVSVSSGYDITPAQIAALHASPSCLIVNSFTPVSEETLMQQALVTLGMDADVQMMPVPDLAPIADTITEMQQEISSSSGISDTFSSGGDFGGGGASGSWDSGSSYDSGSGSSY